MQLVWMDSMILIEQPCRSNFSWRISSRVQMSYRWEWCDSYDLNGRLFVYVPLEFLPSGDSTVSVRSNRESAPNKIVQWYYRLHTMTHCIHYYTEESTSQTQQDWWVLLWAAGVPLSSAGQWYDWHWHHSWATGSTVHICTADCTRIRAKMCAF